MAEATDKRLTLNNHRVEHEGNVWHVDAKFDTATNTLRVYRVYGDITQPAVLNDALQALADATGLQAQQGPRKRGRPRVQRS
jgi:hypothetical protein